MNTAQKTVFVVEGITCSSCVRRVQGALCDVDGVVRAEILLREGKVVVEHDANASIDAMMGALRGAGYPSRLDAVAGVRA